MTEIKKGLPQFSFLNNLQRKPVNIITKKIVCNKYKGDEFFEIHGEYECAVSVYEDGEEIYNTECPICKKEREERALRKEKERQLEEIKTLCRNCNVEPEYYYKTLDDYIPTSESELEAKNAVQDLLNDKLQKVVLLGETGVGKSMLGSIAAKTLNGKIYTMYEICTMIRQSYTVRADKTELEIVNELASLPFLAIDELGRTNGSKSELNWISYVFDKRHVRGLRTMILSNGHKRKDCLNGGCEKCIEYYMGEDVISRLSVNTRIISIKAKDYRSN